jgi:ribosome-binding protein aMBF1 (putative translation factor)
MECKLCGEEVEELYAVKVKGRKRKVCEDCVERLREEASIEDEALGAMQDMMGYKGRF